MICVYPADCSDFSTNGNGTLSPLSANVTETLNGEYELQLVHPIDEAGKWQRLVEGCILRAPVPAAMTPRVNFTAPGDDNRTEVWRVNTDFSGAETRKGTLRLRSGPGTKYKVLATYKKLSSPLGGRLWRYGCHLCGCSYSCAGRGKKVWGHHDRQPEHLRVSLSVYASSSNLQRHYQPNCV